ncbi:glutathione S-transferase family protein [Legionella erythra]|uniref:Glutathione S-transferase n=1 Tax=Legionella erythra TaxID=448 RepID=A0A0W0TVC8_LEGER|nr:glutathione S-transferase family protein [Legionella erythra]KTC99420.1 hypothetical protein Lery_0321 [Legionella erythra]
MITLYQFPGHWGLPNASPFCLKLETYLRMIEMPYEIRFVMDPRKSPKGKLPCLKIEGELLPDSELIIDHLKEKYGDVLDGKLRDEQRALITLLDNTFTERLYWFMLYYRWQEEAGWAHVKPGFFGKLPGIAQWFVANSVRKATLKALHQQGTGRHKPNEVFKLAVKTLDAIAITLGDKKYFLGDELTSIDATAFAFLVNMVWVPYDDPLKSYLQKHRNILNYCERIWSMFYPEIERPFPLVK